jgi:hypothetical protein
MKIIYLYVSILIFLPLTIFCQDNSIENFSNSIGIKSSNISGYGIYYNRKLSEEFKVQFMGLIYYYYNAEDNTEHKNLNYDFGFEIQRDISKITNFRVYILAGAYYYFDDDKLEDKVKKVYKINNSFNVGVGLAFEYSLKRFIFSFDIGYKFFEDRKEITENDKKPYPVLERVTKIGAGIGIGFIF